MSLFSIPPLLARSISSRARKKEVKIEFRFQCSSTLYTILFASSNNICGDKWTKRKFVDCSNLMLYVYCISVSMLTAHTHTFRMSFIPANFMPFQTSTICYIIGLRSLHWVTNETSQRAKVLSHWRNVLYVNYRDWSTHTLAFFSKTLSKVFMWT